VYIVCISPFIRMIQPYSRLEYTPKKEEDQIKGYISASYTCF